MIGKLIKYELRSVLRKFLPLWAGLAALGLINGFSIRHVLGSGRFEGLPEFLLGVLPLILLIGLGMALGVLMLVFICQRFFQGLLGREGYLMFTLPVSSAEHILSKTVSALLLTVLTALVFFVSGSLLLIALDPKELFEGIRYVLSALREAEMPRGLGWLIVEGVLYSLVSAAASVLHVYAAMALGHLASRHRVGWSVLAYVGLNTVLTSGLFQLGIQLSKGGIDRYEFFLDGEGWHGSMIPLAGGLGIMTLISLALCAVFFFLTKFILDRSLNLE